MLCPALTGKFIILLQSFFRGFWATGPCPNWEIFYSVYTFFYTGYMVSCLFVSILYAKGISVKMGIFFLKLGKMVPFWHWEWGPISAP
jgi:hypothetical protein